jgi:tetratricopeptide (TPR) repeat protein
MKSWIVAFVSLLLPITFSGDSPSDDGGPRRQDPVPGQAGAKTRFSNIKFSLGLFKIESSSPNMVLRPSTAGIDSQARMIITPAEPFAGTLKAGCEAAWNALKSGHTVKGEVYTSESMNVPGGGKLMHMGAQFEPEGGAVAIVVVADGKITKLNATINTDVAFQLVGMSLGAFLISIEIAKDAPNPTGTGSAGPPTGPDPGDSFDWDGPDKMEYGIYDHGCRVVEEEFDELLRSNQGLVGSVRPRTVTYTNALNAARLTLQDPEAKKQYDHAAAYGSKEYPKVFLASAATRLMDGDSFGALAQILAGINEAPNDPTLLFNLASILACINMPNESMAVLKQLGSLGKKPNMAAGIDPDVAMNYLAGYNEMLRGNLPEASAKLKAVINADPFLNEASHCLALIAAKQGGNGKSIFKKGLMRFPIRKTAFCVEGQDDPIRPSVDEMFDCSHGIPGKLCEFRQPNGIDNYKTFVKVIGRLMEEQTAELEARKAAVLANVAPIKTNPSPYEKWAEQFFDLMQGLEENEPLFLKLQTDIEKSRKDFQQAAAIHYERLMRRVTELSLDPTPHKCSLYRDASAQALNAIRPYVVHLELMHRRYAKSGYRVLTGMLARYGKGPWRNTVEAYVRSWLTEADVSMVLEVWNCYGTINAGIAGIIHETCLADGNGVGNMIPQPNLIPCPPALKGVGFKYALGLPGDGPKVGAKVDCNGVTFDIDFPFLKAKAPSGLIEYGAGGFGQVEMKWGGEWNVFMGLKGNLGVGGVHGQEKVGIYVKGNVQDGATELGGRVAFEGQAKAGDYTISQKGESMDFAIIPAPKPEKLGPGLKGFRNLEPATNAIFDRLRALQPSSCCSLN